MKVGPPRALPPFVLALISVILLALVVSMILIFYRAFSQSQRLPRWTDTRQVSSPTVNSRWEYGQTARTAQRPSLVARDLFSPPTAAEPGAHRPTRTLQRPEASVTRGTVVIFFQDAYTVLNRQLSINNYPSTRVLERWLPRSDPVDQDGFNYSMA